LNTFTDMPQRSYTSPYLSFVRTVISRILNTSVSPLRKHGICRFSVRNDKRNVRIDLSRFTIAQTRTNAGLPPSFSTARVALHIIIEVVLFVKCQAPRVMLQRASLALFCVGMGRLQVVIERFSPPRYAQAMHSGTYPYWAVFGPVRDAITSSIQYPRNVK
jgi:hypothetical protein